jgi:hypothetical protein
MTPAKVAAWRFDVNVGTDPVRLKVDNRIALARHLTVPLRRPSATSRGSSTYQCLPARSVVLPRARARSAQEGPAAALARPLVLTDTLLGMIDRGEQGG